jgi:hypothetical protein
LGQGAFPRPPRSWQAGFFILCYNYNKSIKNNFFKIMFDDQPTPSPFKPVPPPAEPLKSEPLSPETQPATIPQPPRQPLKTTGRISSAGIVAAIVLVVAVLGVGGYFGYNNLVIPLFLTPKLDINQNLNLEPATPLPIPSATLIEKISDLIGAPVVTATDFASYNEPAVNIKPAIANYQVASDLSNITNVNDFGLQDQAKVKLAQNSFVVRSGYNDEFFSIYESNRYSYTPSFITTDSIVHNYHLAFDYLLRTIETKKLKQAATELTYGLLKASQDQYKQLKGTDWENAAKRNIAFFTVANKLLYPGATSADYVAKEVSDELVLIEAHNQNMVPSPVMNIGLEGTDYNNEDYTQYIPRGHYTKSEDLKVYFKSMMYLGRLTFRLKSDDETKSAVLITSALTDSEDLKNLWNRIYEPTAFFVGVADDLTYVDYGKLMDQIFGVNADLNALSNQDQFNNFLISADSLAGPKINSMPIMDARFAADREEETKGFRLMGQRYTLDADIFQRLIYREVGDKIHACDSDPVSWDASASRRLPAGLDLVSALGSNSAAKIQEDKGETAYACYPQNLNQMRNYVAALSGSTWTQNLYWGWLYALRPLLAEKPAGYPVFMQNEAWQKKDINTFLGSWTELKHDTILYAKQVYAEMGGAAPEQKDDRGYIEPNPYVYARLVALTKMMKEGLQLRSLLSEKEVEFLDRLEIVSAQLKTISEKELNNQALSEADYDFIRNYGGILEHLWLDAYSDQENPTLDNNPAALVADVASDPNGQVLEEGVGRVNEILVVVPIDGQLRLAKGGIFSYYEFSWPINDRLTDEKWREMLRNDQAPALPEWTSAFMAAR